jgi:hypothetical protein
MKRKIFKILTTFVLLSTLIGTVGALNGFFGGGGNKIPEDTFTRGLVAYWSFDEGSGTTAYDASGNGNHGTIYGAKWTQGKSGTGLSFDGVDDYVDCGNAASLNITSAITIEVWVKFPKLITEYPSSQWPSIVEKGGSYYIWVNGGQNIELGIYKGGAVQPLYLSSSLFQKDVWYHLVFTYDGSYRKAYLNGELKAAGSTTRNIDITANPVYIGRHGTQYFSGLIDEVRIYNRALSPEEIRFHYSRGGPVAYWKFDEGQGTKVYDLSGNNNGTLNLGTSGNTDPSKAWVPGKFASALSFDGVDDYVEVPNSASLNPKTALTVVAWVYPKSTGSMRIVSNGYTGYGALNYDLGTTGWYLHLSGSGYVGISFSGLINNTWNFVVATYDSITGTANVFVNAIKVKEVTGLSGEIYYQYGGQPIRVGIGASGSFTYFNGLIDEVRIYNYARTPDEIRLDYNAGYAARFGPGTDCNSDPGSCMTKGLVAYWSFDEGSGNIAYDASGNGNHGTIYGAKWTQGKIGGALSFDGVDDYVSVPNSASLNLSEQTIEFWFAPPSGSGYNWQFPYVRKNDATTRNYYIYGARPGEAIVYEIRDPSNNYHSLIGNKTNYELGKWYHFAGTYKPTTGEWKIFINGQLDAQKIEIFTPGTNNASVIIGGSRFNGLIDEVRIYNRALSEEEIRYHYNHTLPKGALSPLAMKEDPSLVGYWSFNEGKGTTIYDQSGKNNNGTLYLGSSGNTDPSKAWSPGISGTALSFDGVDDYVEVPNSASLNSPTQTNALTLAAWVYLKSDPPTETYIIDKSFYQYEVRIYKDREFKAYLGNGTNYNNYLSGYYVPLNEWHFLVLTADGSKVRFYVDGVLVKELSQVRALGSTTYPVTIGWRSTHEWNHFNGLIDEVRIYNRALSEQEILEHYRNSKYYLASHFGPKTNCREDPGSCIDYGLVGYWSFDEGAGTTAYDASGKGNNGTIYGAKWTQGALAPSKSGAFGTGLSFDGVNDYVDLPNSTSLNITTPITLAAWIYPRVCGSEDIISRGEMGDPRNSMWLSLLSDCKIKFGYEYGSGTNVETLSSSVIKLNEWNFVVAVWDGSYSKISINGGSFEGVISAPNSPGPFDQPFRIGFSYIGGYFNGLIDEVRIYNRALSEEEIRYLYNRGAPIAHWKFDEGKGDIAYDSSGNGNNGTLINGPTWVSGKFGSALSFDGVDDYVEATVTQNKTTYSLWIKPDGESWQHVVKVDSTYYVNGVPSTSAIFPIYVSGNTVQIGKTSASTYFKGIIDDVRIYNYKRTQTQILQDYNAGLSTHFK